ncbi:MAG TPA: 16S rRNA (guanine(527)-N(7))-methyltransferase RsmG [Steroidobacteraceae bacterium]|nr:16S rRNA (guanine(527)-N(7))-methyltransferase RsmG [Steroidobacteraceae bacterium]
MVVHERAQLIEGARRMGVELTEDSAASLLRLMDELERWNAAYNLTSIRSRQAMLTHHLLDSLSIHSHLRGVTIADLGTGAGFPGLPLALTNPNREFTLIDANNKKVRFVTHAARELGLANVTVTHARVETLDVPTPFDTVVARAFAPLPRLLQAAEALCGRGTRVLAMKGRITDGEIEGLPAPWSVVAVQPLDVPHLGAARHLVVLEPRGL